MNGSHWSRRGLMVGAAGAALARHGAAAAAAANGMPDGACDCHLHIYDPRFPYQPNAQLKPPPATVADYRAVQRRLGTSRAVIVTPSTYGTDNAHLLDALGQLGDTARGVAVCHADISMAELRRMHAAGVRGVRVQFGRGSIVGAEEILPLARRVAPLGWHMQFNMPVEDYAKIADVLMRVPTTIVIDHFGRTPPDPQTAAPAHYALMRRLLDRGRTWMKLSSPYTDSKSGPPAYADMAAVARDFLAHAPERMVWASNWPYPDVAPAPAPDPVHMLRLLPTWAPDPFLRHRMLVENPERLYGFDPAKRPKPA